MEPISATVTAVLATLRAAKEAAKHIKNADLTERLQKAYDHIGDIRHQIFALEDENRRLAKENEELKNIKQLEAELQFDGHVYWRTLQDKKLGPYCPNCWHDQKHRQLVPLRQDGGNAYYCTIHQIYWRSGFCSSVPSTIKPYMR